MGNEAVEQQKPEERADRDYPALDGPGGKSPVESLDVLG